MVDRRDGAAGFGAVALFSLSLSTVSVAVPILIVAAGYTLTEVGALIALSALAQMAARLRIGTVMRVLADKDLVYAAALLMALGSGLLVWSSSVAAIVVSQLLQGAARGFFWTGVQTHAVRVAPTSARGMATVNLAGGVGLVVGPLLAGLALERSAQVALAAAAVVAVAALLPTARLVRLPPFPPRDSERPHSPVTRVPGVRAGAWVTASAGAWRGLMGAYIPVVLHEAAHPPAVIGTVVALTNGATVVAGWAAGRVGAHRFAAAVGAGTVAAGAGLAVAAVAAGSAVGSAAALMVSGLGMGVLQTLGPAAATESVAAEDRGDAIAAVGLYRAAATFAAPFGVAGLLLAVPLGPALAAAGVAIALPAASVRLLRRPGEREA